MFFLQHSPWSNHEICKGPSVRDSSAISNVCCPSSRIVTVQAEETCVTVQTERIAQDWPLSGMVEKDTCVKFFPKLFHTTSPCSTINFQFPQAPSPNCKSQSPPPHVPARWRYSPQAPLYLRPHPATTTPPVLPKRWPIAAERSSAAKRWSVEVLKMETGGTNLEILEISLSILRMYIHRFTWIYHNLPGKFIL